MNTMKMRELTESRELTPAELEEVSGGVENVVADFKYGSFRLTIISNPIATNVGVSNNYGSSYTWTPV
jgi:hypothetical protein